MVYTKVQIIRGCIIPKSILKQYYYEIVKPEQENNDIKRKDDIENDDWYSNDNDLDILKSLQSEFENDCRDYKDKFQIRFYGPCHGLNDIIIGIEILSHDRLQWSWEQSKEKLNEIKKNWKDTEEKFDKFVKIVLMREEWCSDRSPFCGKFDGDIYCGEYTVCDECLGITTNGFYNVCNIIDNIVECNFDYETNKEIRYEKKEKNGGDKEKKSNNLLTSDILVDKMIKNIINNLDINMKENDIKIGTYYCIDDCLSCT